MKNFSFLWAVLFLCSLQPTAVRAIQRPRTTTGIVKLGGQANNHEKPLGSVAATENRFEVLGTGTQTSKNKELLVQNVLDIRGGGIPSTLFHFVLRNPGLILLMVSSSLVSINKDTMRYPKLTQALLQGCIVVYVLLSLLEWQSEKEAERHATHQ